MRSDEDRNLFKSSWDIGAQAPKSEAKGGPNAFEVIRSNSKKSPMRWSGLLRKRWNKKFYTTSTIDWLELKVDSNESKERKQANKGIVS